MFSVPADQIEAYLALIIVAIALVFPAFGRRVFNTIRSILLPFARHPRLAVALAGILPVVLRLVLLVWEPVTPPRSMEEHNHLLQADTYAHWRLANPVHPLSILFYSYQIVTWPHYVSSRPPLSSIFFAVGEIFFHSPFLGNLLSVGILSACIYWMLLGWVPRLWAAFGSLLVVCQFCIFGYWVDSYWGPTAPILGGVILLGLAPRVSRHVKLVYALWFVVGISLLLGTRPYEGCFCVAVIVIFLLYPILWRAQERQWRPQITKFVIPVIAGCCLMIAAQIYYDIATTGKPLQMPYQIWRESQTAVPTFIWQPVAAKRQTFAFPGQLRFMNWEIKRVEPLHRNLARTAYILLARHGISIRDIVGPLMLIPLLCWSGTWIFRRLAWRQKLLILIGFLLLIYCMNNVDGYKWWSGILNLEVLIALVLRWHDRHYRLPLLLVLIGTLATSFSSFYMNNYFTPFVGAVIILIVTGLRNLSRWDRKGGTGASLAGLLSLGVLIVLAWQVSATLIKHPPYAYSEMGYFNLRPFTVRSRLAAQLDTIPGKHLVLEPPTKDNIISTNHDLVWNLADIDKQRIVWARDLRPTWTATAIHYYPDRKVWIVSGSNRNAHLEPYPTANLPNPVPISTLPMPDKPKATR